MIAVGGGLAGAAFAIELARHGVRVIVLESSRGPRHVVCGEFLSEEAQNLLRQLGLDPHTRGATSIERFRLVKGERHAITHLPFAAAGLSRYRLDEVLLEAAERAGAEVVRGARVMRIEPGTGTVIVREAERMWHAAAVGLATGKHSMRGFSTAAESDSWLQNAFAANISGSRSGWNGPARVLPRRLCRRLHR